MSEANKMLFVTICLKNNYVFVTTEVCYGHHVL